MPKKTPKWNSTVNKAARERASLDHWIGPSQHIGDGVSSDPAIKWDAGQPGVRRSPSDGDSNA